MEINCGIWYTASKGDWEKFREKERLRAKARHDEAQALYNARKERDIEIAKKLLKRNRPVDEIVEDTGLTYEEVEDLRIKSWVYSNRAGRAANAFPVLFLCVNLPFRSTGMTYMDRQTADHDIGNGFPVLVCRSM